MTEEKKSKGFFALDVDQFFNIQDKGLGIEEAAAYLALMKGTDQTNTISRGGVNSVTEYTGLTRAEAKRAIDQLVLAKLVERIDVDRLRAKTVPRFKLPPYESRKPLAAQEASVVAAIGAGNQPTSTSDKNAAFRAMGKGWLEKLSTGWAPVPGAQRIAYIPNLFVDSQGQTSPLERLVQIGEIGPLMLTAELYHKQDLMNERGVPTSDVRAYYQSRSSVTAGSTPSGFRLHNMTEGRSYKMSGEEKSFAKAYEPSKFRHPNETFWTDLRALDAAHVTEWAIYSANGKPADEYAFNRPQRPLGVLRNGKHVRNIPEADVSFVSYMMWTEQERLKNAANASTAEEARNFWCEYAPLIVVENAHVTHVEGVGILRMVHRADTENTAQWWRDLHKQRRESLFFLEGVLKAAFPEIISLHQDRQDQSESSTAISM